MRSPFWIGLGLATVFLLLCPPSFAAAQRGQAADVLVREGYRLRREGRYEEALNLLRQAQELQPTPRGLAQIASVEGRLERWLDAETHLRQALAETEDEYIQTNRTALERALASIRTHLGGLVLEGGIAGEGVFVDGESRGSLPIAPFWMEAGEHRVELRGREEGWNSEVTMAEGETLRVTLPGVAAEPEPPELAEATEPAEAMGAADQTVQEMARREEVSAIPNSVEPISEGGGTWTPGWILAGAGGVLILAGVIAGGVAIAEAQSRDTDFPVLA